MNYTVSNQKIGTLLPYYTDDLTKELDYDLTKENLKEVLKPVWKPLQPQYPVEITDDKGNIINDDDLTDLLITNMQQNIQTGDKALCDIWKQTLLNYAGTLTAAEVFTSQAYGDPNINKKQFPLPAATVIYQVEDIKNASRQYLGNKAFFNELFISTAFYMNSDFLGFTFLTKFTFEEFKNMLKQMTLALNASITSDTAQKLADFDKIDLKTVEGLILRLQDGDDNDAYSFSRIISKALISFAKTNDDAEIITPYIDELIAPKNLLLMNIDGLAKTNISRLRNEFDDIKTGINSKFKPVSLKKLATLSSVAVNKRRMVNAFNHHQQIMANLAKRNMFKFKKVAMTKNELNKIIAKIVKKEVNVSASENYTKVTKPSFLRSNRRNPDDFNIPGKAISIQYKPDIHIYLDTSGSISEENYKSAILMLITMAKKLDVNLYFNSFADTVTKKVKLNLKGKSVKQIYKEFQKVPKLTGGTNFKAVWDYIMASPKRQKEISLMITDFMWNPPSHRPDYPKKLYYAPIAVTSQWEWDEIKKWAEKFTDGMYHIDYNIRKKILIS